MKHIGLPELTEALRRFAQERDWDQCHTAKNLPPPDVIAQEIMNDLEAALEQVREILPDLGNGARKPASSEK